MSTIYLARVDGPCDDHVSAHSTFELAIDALLQVSRVLHLDRFGYVPTRLPDRLRGSNDPRVVLRHVEDVMTGSGWRARIDELVVDAVPELAATGQPV